MIQTVKRIENGRDNKGKFIKGNKGGGRKPIPEDIKQAFKELVPDALEVLEQLLKSDDERLRLDASKTILDRVYGKPRQESDINLKSTGKKFEDFFKD
jgi:hypothetical protein